MTRVACIGEAMIELALDPNGAQARVGVAGDTLNTAIYLKRSAPSLDVAFVTRLGRDAFSDRIEGCVTSEGLDTSAIERDPDRGPGLYAITTDARGERSFTYWRDNSAARRLFQSGAGTDFSVLDDFDVVYLSAITLAILPDPVRLEFCNWATGFRGAGGRIVFDSNYRPRLWASVDEARARIAGLWSICDIALPSADDEAALTGDATVQDTQARLAVLGVHDGALKRGEAGPISLSAPVEQTYPRATNVVDTTAAGDSFNGAYLAARLTGADQATALSAGHDLALRVIGHRGAITPREDA